MVRYWSPIRQWVLLSGVDLLDLGPRRLRDVPIPFGVFQVRSAGLRVEFPPLRALNTTPGNLRPAGTRLIGRESDVEAITTAVRSHRLVTLTGVGGVGKTRLALEVAAQLADEFPDGVWLFELAAVTDPAAVPDAVAAVLGITQQPGKTVSESVAAALEGRVAAVGLRQLRACARRRGGSDRAILAHSATVESLPPAVKGWGRRRAPSGQCPRWISGESNLPRRTCSSIAPSCAPGVLAGRRPTSSSSGGDLSADSTGPLGIELAASRMASMTASEVATGSVTGSGCSSDHGAAGRHQTLRHAVAVVLRPAGRHRKSVLNRCSVFAGGFDLAKRCA